jgi:DHA3 family macrolide efflux protein-like MFS transporter
MNLFALFTTQGIAIFTGQLLTFALVWQLTIMFHSPLLLSVCAGAGILLNMLATPWIGQWVDRSHRLKVASAGDAISLLCSIIFGAYLIWLNGRQYALAIIVALYAIRILGGGIQTTAFMAALSDMGNDGTRARLFARWQMISAAGGLLAAPIAAIAMSKLQLIGFAIVDAGALLLAVANALRVSRRVPMHAVDSEAIGTNRAATRNLRAAWDLVRKNRTLLAFIAAIPVLNFVAAPIGTLLPMLVKFDWHLGVGNLAFAEALFGVGILSSSIIQSVFSITLRREFLIIIGLILLSISIGLLGGWQGAPTYQLLGAIFACGFSSMIANIPLQTCIANDTPEEMRGRVDSILILLTNISAPLGLFIFGVVAEIISTRAVIWIGACIMLLTCFFVMLSVKRSVYTETSDVPEGDTQSLQHQNGRK